MSSKIVATVNPQVVFLCGARDYHAIDWYKSSLRLNLLPRPIIVTDLIQAEGFTKIITSSDNVYNLFILDPLLLPFQGFVSNIWRNFLKLVVFPFQVYLLIRFSKKYPDSIFYAHSMYYIWLAAAARLKFVGTPQGSEILIRVRKSLIYRYFSKIALHSALFVTVDSRRMAKAILGFSGIEALIIQNGIDTSSILDFSSKCQTSSNFERRRILSIRGMTPLYRIDHIVRSRTCSASFPDIGIDFVFPSYDTSYMQSLVDSLSPIDIVFGRVTSQRLYELCNSALLCISIPSSDSSPRSVYEAIFCGCIVAVTWHDYINDLPESMRSRVFVADLNDGNWFDNAISYARSQLSVPFKPCSHALRHFDQVESFNSIHQTTLSLF